jgi:hypothetical protein
MGKKLSKIGALCLGALLFFGCEKENDLESLRVSDKSDAHVPAGCEIIDFNQYNTGFITQVNSASGMGPIAVYNKARSATGSLTADNRAMIFDTYAPTGDDTDLYTGVGSTNGAMLGKVLIINQIGENTVPNDNQWGGEMSLNFSALGPVTIKSVTVVDIDSYEDNSYIHVYGAGDALLKSVKLSPLGNNTVQIADINQSGVVKMKVVLAGNNGFVGSGAIDNIIFCKDVPPPPSVGCTKTQGYWKNHASGKKADPAWGSWASAQFFSSGKTYLEILNTPPKGGDAYIILAHQYIAAKLNVAAGASMPANVQTAYNGATTYFNGGSSPSRSTLIQWADMLASYNEGKIGPGHCD